MSVMHTIQDPARVALCTVLDETLRQGRFPRRKAFLKKYPSMKRVIGKLLANRRYLALSECPDKTGAQVVRVAVTVPGIYEVENEQGQHEQAQLAVLLSLIQGWVRDYGAFSELTSVADAHRDYGIQCEITHFARWLTMLCSPRLWDPPGGDPRGFYGQSVAWCMPDPETGFVDRFLLWGHFDNHRLPTRAQRKLQLLPDNTLRCESEPTGSVVLYEGLHRLAAIKPGLGASVFKLLFDLPDRTFDILDVQAAAAGLADLRSINQGDDLVNSYLEKWRLDRVSLERDERRRLQSLCRRLELFQNMPKRDNLPKWATKPAVGYTKLEDELRAQLVDARLPGDFSPIKNATRVIRRALKDALAPAGFDGIRDRFSVGETAVFRSKK